MLDQIRRIAFTEDYIEKTYRKDFTVAENDIEIAWSNVIQIAKEADATNAVLFVTASNIVRRVRAGDDFKKLADQFSQDMNSDDNAYIAQTKYDDFDNERPGVKAAIMRLRVGEVSDPLDSDEGIAIYRLDNKAITEDGEGLKLQRITLHRMLKYDYDDKDALATDLRKQSTEAMRRTAITNMLSRVSFKFPSGFDEFTPRELKYLRLFSKDVPVGSENHSGISTMLEEALKHKEKRQ